MVCLFGKMIKASALSEKKPPLISCPKIPPLGCNLDPLRCNLIKIRLGEVFHPFLKISLPDCKRPAIFPWSYSSRPQTKFGPGSMEKWTLSKVCSASVTGTTAIKENGRLENIVNRDRRRNDSIKEFCTGS